MGNAVQGNPTRAEEREKEKKKKQCKLGVCRIRRKQENQSSETLGSGFVVQDLQIVQAFYYPHCLISSSKVFPDDCNIKSYYLDFKKLNKQNLETIELGDIARSTEINRNLYPGLVLIPISPSKRYNKKESIFTYRPFKVGNKERCPNQDWQCHFVDDGQPIFSVKRSNLRQSESNPLQYQLNEGLDCYTTYNEVTKGDCKPYGGAILLKNDDNEYVVVGAMTFTDDDHRDISPVFFCHSSGHECHNQDISVTTAERTDAPEATDSVAGTAEIVPLHLNETHVESVTGNHIQVEVENTVDAATGNETAHQPKLAANSYDYRHAPTDPVPEGTVTGAVSGAAASARDSRCSTGVRSCWKQKSVERGVLPLKIHCFSATSRYSSKQDPQEQSVIVNKYMAKKIEEVTMKGKFDLSSFEGLEDYCMHLRGHLSLAIMTMQEGCIKITVKCRTLEILERLWDDCCSGRLSDKTEKCLITENVKEELGMETIKLATTILKEDYLACKHSLMETAVSGYEHCNQEINVTTAERTEVPNLNQEATVSAAAALETVLPHLDETNVESLIGSPIQMEAEDTVDAATLLLQCYIATLLLYCYIPTLLHRFIACIHFAAVDAAAGNETVQQPTLEASSDDHYRVSGYEHCNQEINVTTAERTEVPNLNQEATVSAAAALETVLPHLDETNVESLTGSPIQMEAEDTVDAATLLLQCYIATLLLYYYIPTLLHRFIACIHFAAVDAAAGNETVQQPTLEASSDDHYRGLANLQDQAGFAGDELTKVQREHQGHELSFYSAMEEMTQGNSNNGKEDISREEELQPSVQPQALRGRALGKRELPYGSVEITRSFRGATAMDRSESAIPLKSDELVENAILHNVSVMDAVRRRLDMSCRGIQNWRHLASLNGVSESLQLKCQAGEQQSRSEKMFELLSTTDPDLLIGTLKQHLRDLNINNVELYLQGLNLRDDEKVVDFLESSDLNIPGRAFIMLDLIPSDTWRNLGVNMGVDRKTLEHIKIDCANQQESPAGHVINMIKQSQPTMPIRQLRKYLIDIGRIDVARKLDRLSGKGTIEDLCRDLDLMRDVTSMLSGADNAQIKNYKDLAAICRIPRNVYESLQPPSAESPTKEVLNDIVKKKPRFTVEELFTNFCDMKRVDVIEAISPYFVEEDMRTIKRKLKISYE